MDEHKKFLSYVNGLAKANRRLEKKIEKLEAESKQDKALIRKLESSTGFNVTKKQRESMNRMKNKINQLESNLEEVRNMQKRDRAIYMQAIKSAGVEYLLDVVVDNG